MDKDLAIRFLLQSTIQGLEITDCKEKLDLNTQKFTTNIQAVTKKAHRDVLTGRFHLPNYCSEMSNNKNSVVQSLEKLILENKQELNSTTLIDALCNEYPHVEFGAIQKLVNMTLKYIITINTVIPAEFIRVDESNCDCPIDSKILNKLKAENHKTHTSWTKLHKTEYIQIQNEIQSLIDKRDGNILFDFYNW